MAEKTKTADTAKKEEKNVVLPKGITKENYDKARKIIVSGFKAGASADQIKTGMFEQGIPFSDLMRLYKKITINEGLVKSSKEIAKEVEKALEGEVVAISESLPEDHEGVTYDMIDPVVAKVKGLVPQATEKRILSAIKKGLEARDLAMPSKPKVSRTRGSASGGKIATAIVDSFAAKKDLTADEFKEVISKVTTEKSTKKWCRMYKMFSALANGKNAQEGLA